MILRKRKYLVGSILIVVALGVLLFNSLVSCSVHAYTVTELLELGESAYGETIRVDGLVREGSVVRDSQAVRLTFELVDEDETAVIPIVYSGVEPDLFREGRGVTVEGEYFIDGRFVAKSIFTKCASKYVPEG